MKYLFVSCLCLFSLASYSQSPKDTTAKGKGKDGPHAPALTDSTAIIQLLDIQELNTLIQDYPARYANPITQWLQERFQLRLKEYQTKNR